MNSSVIRRKQAPAQKRFLLKKNSPIRNKKVMFWKHRPEMKFIALCGEHKSRITWNMIGFDDRLYALAMNLMISDHNWGSASIGISFFQFKLVFIDFTRDVARRQTRRRIHSLLGARLHRLEADQIFEPVHHLSHIRKKFSRAISRWRHAMTNDHASEWLDVWLSHLAAAEAADFWVKAFELVRRGRNNLV